MKRISFAIIVIVFTLFIYHMILTNMESHVRVRHNKAKRLFLHIDRTKLINNILESHIDDPFVILRLNDIYMYDKYKMDDDKFTTNEYAVIKEGNTIILYRGKKDRAEEILQHYNNNMLIQYDPTNGIYSNGFDYMIMDTSNIIPE